VTGLGGEWSAGARAHKAMSVGFYYEDTNEKEVSVSLWLPGGHSDQGARLEVRSGDLGRDRAGTWKER
jgi:hypothetical protein